VHVLRRELSGPVQAVLARADTAPAAIAN
jgi:hypothetical protein